MAEALISALIIIFMVVIPISIATGSFTFSFIKLILYINKNRFYYSPCYNLSSYEKNTIKQHKQFYNNYLKENGIDNYTLFFMTGMVGNEKPNFISDLSALYLVFHNNTAEAKFKFLIDNINDAKKFNEYKSKFHWVSESENSRVYAPKFKKLPGYPYSKKIYYKK